MFLDKRFSLYACFLHGLIVALFVFWGVSNNEEKEDKEKIKVSRIVEVDVFKPAQDAVMAESITNDELIQKILSTENLSKTFTQEEKIAKAEEEEKIRFNKAKIVQAKKEEKRKLEREKEKARIKEENKKLQEKLEKEQEILKNKKEKIKKDIERAAKDKKEKEARLKKEREIKLEKQNKENIKKYVKPVKNNDRKVLSKSEWLETSSGKADYEYYSSALYTKVYSKWIKPFHAKTGWNCSLEIHQDKNGRVKNIKELNCNPNNSELRNSVQKAVMQASPLPLPKDPRLFDQTVIFKFSVE